MRFNQLSIWRWRKKRDRGRLFHANHLLVVAIKRGFQDFWGSSIKVLRGLSAWNQTMSLFHGKRWLIHRWIRYLLKRDFFFLSRYWIAFLIPFRKRVRRVWFFTNFRRGKIAWKRKNKARMARNWFRVFRRKFYIWN